MNSLDEMISASLAAALKGAIGSLKEELRDMIEEATAAKQELHVYVPLKELAALHRMALPTVRRYLGIASLEDSVRSYNAEPEEGKRGIVRYNAADFEAFMLRYSKKNMHREGGGR